MTVRIYANEFLEVAENAAEGLGLIIDGNGDIALADASGQGTVAALRPYGIALRDLAVGENADGVVLVGEVTAIAGDAIAGPNVDLVAEAGSGKMIPYDADDYDEGAEIYIWGTSMTAATADLPFQMFLQPRLHTVPTAPEA